MLEVGLIGWDGVVGVGVCPTVHTMTCDAVTQIAGTALRLDAQVLRRELSADATLSAQLGRHAELLYIRCMQRCVCDMFHTVEQRCVRWLLTAHDLVAHDEIPLTHELLATTLGVHRPTVTLVLGSLHRAGLVEEERGRVVIRDRSALEVASCECYRVLRRERQRLLGA
jgi:CRP-like cAMP-binding protein